MSSTVVRPETSSFLDRCLWLSG